MNKERAGRHRHLNRNPETVRKYMARYRKEKYYD